MRLLRVESAVAVFAADVHVTDILRPVAVHAQDGDRTATVRRALTGGGARNILLFSGDGMGDSDITAASNSAVGASGHLAVDTLPLTGQHTTYAVQGIDPAVKVVGITDQTDLFRMMLRAMPPEALSR